MGRNKLEVRTVPDPEILSARDAIVKITATAICGSDLHIYRGKIPMVETGDILSHEFMGIVEDIGVDVTNVEKGDRVVASCVIACGKCWYCKRGYFSSCDTTNPSKAQEELYGHHTAGFFGYSHVTGGYDGGQAEYVRVPFADVNCHKVPVTLTDDQALLLSDVIPTGWHACELGKVAPDDTVAVWGSGPIGLMAMAWAKFRGAKRIIAIDNVQYRLDIAREKLGAIPINYDTQDVLKHIKELNPLGVDVAIDAVGFEYSKTWRHRIQRALGLETDSLDVLTEAIQATRKCGRVSVMGVYVASGNQFPIGAFMEKGLSMAGGQVTTHSFLHFARYWSELLSYIESRWFDPTFVISHHMPLVDAPAAYEMLANREDKALKIILHTPAYYLEHPPVK